MATEEDFKTIRAQGFRCGYIDGKRRVGSYVVGEELLSSYEAADAQNFQDNELRTAFAHGYQRGYCCGVVGAKIPERYK